MNWGSALVMMAVALILLRWFAIYVYGQLVRRRQNRLFVEACRAIAWTEQLVTITRRKTRSRTRQKGAQS